MEGIAEDDAGPVLRELRRAHRLDRAVGADRHEDRRLDVAVRERQLARARGAVSVQ